jgi:hypothetical protein
MRAYDPNLPLFSIHVPKCGGTTMSSVLRQWFRGRYYQHYETPATNASPPHHDLRAGMKRRDRWLRPKAYPPHVCVHGHFNNILKQGVLDYYPDAKQFITFLRDPFDVSLSVYFYAKAKGENWYDTGQANANWAKHPTLDAYLENVMFKKPSLVPNYFPFPPDVNAIEKNLQASFVYVGIVGDMATSLRQLAKRLGFPEPETPHKNDTQWDEPIPEDARTEYRKQNPAAYALYDFARAHYMD